jgi:hypothetical protein
VPEHFIAVMAGRKARGEPLYAEPTSWGPVAEATSAKSPHIRQRMLLDPLWRARERLRPRPGDLAGACRSGASGRGARATPAAPEDRPDGGWRFWPCRGDDRRRIGNAGRPGIALSPLTYFVVPHAILTCGRLDMSAVFAIYKQLTHREGTIYGSICNRVRSRYGANAG